MGGNQVEYARRTCNGNIVGLASWKMKSATVAEMQHSNMCCATIYLAVLWTAEILLKVSKKTIYH